MRKTKCGAQKPVTAQEVLAILQSASGYCQQVGLVVQVIRQETDLILRIPGFYDVAANTNGEEQLTRGKAGGTPFGYQADTSRPVGVAINNRQAEIVRQQYRSDLRYRRTTDSAE